MMMRMIVIGLIVVGVSGCAMKPVDFVKRDYIDKKIVRVNHVKKPRLNQNSPVYISRSHQPIKIEKAIPVAHAKTAKHVAPKLKKVVVAEHSVKKAVKHHPDEQETDSNNEPANPVKVNAVKKSA